MAAINAQCLALQLHTVPDGPCTIIAAPLSDKHLHRCAAHMLSNAVLSHIQRAYSPAGLQELSCASLGLLCCSVWICTSMLGYCYNWQTDGSSPEVEALLRYYYAD